MGSNHLVASSAMRRNDRAWLSGHRTNLFCKLGQTNYLASSASLLDLLRDLEDDPGSVLMVGHNPGLEDLIFELVPDDGSSPLRDIVEEKFPTATFAVLELDIDSWDQIDGNCARLIHLVRPRDLDPALGPEALD